MLNWLAHMPARGKFVVIEGIDGSGKGTQLEMLVRAFSERAIPFERISFPNYSGFFGKIAGQFLNGDFGPLNAVDPHFSALLYAGDRWESKPAMEAALASGKTLLADRYVSSNLAHQGSRVPAEKRSEFLTWLRHLEYQVYGLPVEDLVIYLRLPVEQAHRLVGEKAARNYTERRRDIQEANRAHLAEAASVYEEISRRPDWVTVECTDASGALRTPAAIHEEIISAIASRLLAQALTAG
jgi:dTMP kinase